MDATQPGTSSPGSRPMSSAGEIESLSHGNSPLVVSVSIRFTDPIIRSTYHRTYGSSPTFKPSDRICDGLARRIEHCCEELITRRDSTALLMTREGTDTPKPLRFEMTFTVVRRDTAARTERTFRSFQKQPLTVALAREVTLASHRIIGLFLSHHDKDFKWLDGSLREEHRPGRETVAPTLDAPIPPCCVPRSRFIESSQSFEFIPGYTIEVSFRSRNPELEHGGFVKVLKVNSRQSSPLNLMLSEDLLWQSFQSVHSALESKKRQFDEQHASCELLEGPSSTCRHFGEEALYLVLRVSNNLGPSYDHLRRELLSKLVLFSDREGRDCQDFLSTVECELAEARDGIDSRISQMDDFELRILELSSPTWSIKDPLRFSLDPSASYSRRSIKAVVERVQTGIGDVLRGNDITIKISAYKRGHLIMRKTLIAHRDPADPRRDTRDPEEEKKDIVSQLRARIREDIDMVCKNTCSLDDIPESDEKARLELESNDLGKHQEGALDTPVEDTGVGGAREPHRAPVQRRFPLVGNSKVLEKEPREGRWAVVDDRDLAGTRCSPTDAIPGDVEDQTSTAEPSTPRRTYSLPGSTPGQRAFPLVPERFYLPSRVSSGCILPSEPCDLPATGAERNPEREETAQEGSTQEGAPKADKETHPAEPAIEASVAANPAMDSKSSEANEECRPEPAPPTTEECPAPQPVEEEDSGVVIEKPVSVNVDPDNTVGGLPLTAQEPVSQAEEAGAIAADAGISLDEEPEVVEKHVAVEEAVFVDKSATAEEPEPTGEVLLPIHQKPDEKPEAVDEAEHPDKPKHAEASVSSRELEPAGQPQTVESSVPVEEPAAVDDPVLVPGPGSSAETSSRPPEASTASRGATMEAAHESDDKDHNETCSFTPLPLIDTSDGPEIIPHTPQGLSRFRRDSTGGVVPELGSPCHGSDDDNDDDIHYDYTAPSTPGLSSGCESSPRNSLIITPHNLVTMPGAVERPRIASLHDDYIGPPSGVSIDGLRGACTPEESPLLRRGGFPKLLEQVSGPAMEEIFPTEGTESNGKNLEFERFEQGPALLPPLGLSPSRSPSPGPLPGSDPSNPDEDDAHASVEKPDTEQASEPEQADQSVAAPEFPEFDCGSSFVEVELEISTPKSLARFGPPLIQEVEGEPIQSLALGAPEATGQAAATQELVRWIPDRATERCEDEAVLDLPTEESGLSSEPILRFPFPFSFRFPLDIAASILHDADPVPTMEPNNRHQCISETSSCSSFDFDFDFGSDIDVDISPSTVLSGIEKEYRPATAGYLGLRDSLVIDVGLRGALGDFAHRRHASLPPADGLSSLSDKHHHHGAGADMTKGSGSEAKDVGAEDGDNKRVPDSAVEKSTLPKMVMIFAGMAFASKVLNGAE